jgi:hypothetical protein
MIEIPEAPASDNPDTLQQNAVQTQHRVSNATVLITEAQMALGTAAATGCAPEGTSVGCTSEPHLRRRGEAITTEAAAQQTPNGASGERANGT